MTNVAQCKEIEQMHFDIHLGMYAPTPVVEDAEDNYSAAVVAPKLE